MNWVSDVQRAIHYIEANLLADIRSEDVARHVHASKDYFQRVFGIVTGYTVGEYIRNRRLSLAAQELLQPGARVLETALKYGYETPESFTKAFTRFHGCPPAEVRDSRRELPIFHPLTIQINVKGGLNMSKQLIAQIPVRQLISMYQGQNYWFNGCMDFLMECLGEDRAYDYWFFSGVTGDSFLQVFSKDPERMALCYSDVFTDIAVQKAFAACGYFYERIKGIGAPADRARYDLRIRQFIDKGVPVIARVQDAFHSFAIICGYDAERVYCVMGESNTPEPCSYDELIFATYKKEQPPLASVYREAVLGIPALIAMPETAAYSFGKKAFVDWAKSFQSGAFDAYAVEDSLWYTHESPNFYCWNQHGTYLCMLGTNACAGGFLEKALELNPDMAFIRQLLPLYGRLNGEGFQALIGMEGGFGLKPEVAKDRERMAPISEKILELASINDEILGVFAGLGKAPGAGQP